MRIWKSKLTGMCLAVLVLMAVLYADRQRTVDFHICVAEPKVSGQYLSHNITISSVKACTTEMLGNYEGAGIHRVAGQESKTKREMKQSLCFLNADNSLLLTMPAAVSAYEETEPFTCSREEQITTYIHKSDGKKRI